MEFDGALGSDIVLCWFPWSLYGSKTPLKKARVGDDSLYTEKVEGSCSRLQRPV